MLLSYTHSTGTLHALRARAREKLMRRVDRVFELAWMSSRFEPVFLARAWVCLMLATGCACWIVVV